MIANAGYIKLFRQFKEWEWYQDANVMRVFLHLLLCANTEDKRWKGIDIRRGQFVTSVAHLAIALSLSEHQIRTALDKLESTKEIQKSATNKFTILTICKFDNYQSSQDSEWQTNDNQNAIKTQTNDNPLTNDRQTNVNQVSTTKEEQEYKNNISLSLGADEKIFAEDEKKREQDTKWIGLMKMPFTTWVEDSCRLLRLSKEELDMYIDTFSLEMKAKCTYHTSWQDITSHFISWVKCERDKNKKQINNGKETRSTPNRRTGVEPPENIDYSA